MHGHCKSHAHPMAQGDTHWVCTPKLELFSLWTMGQYKSCSLIRLPASGAVLYHTNTEMAELLPLSYTVLSSPSSFLHSSLWNTIHLKSQKECTEFGFPCARTYSWNPSLPSKALIALFASLSGVTWKAQNWNASSTSEGHKWPEASGCYQ